MSGILIIPLWRGAKFWLIAFPDGRHLAGVFKLVRKMRIKTHCGGVSQGCFRREMGVLFGLGDKQSWNRSYGFCNYKSKMFWAYV
jgi:hypothetical protein